MSQMPLARYTARSLKKATRIRAGLSRRCAHSRHATMLACVVSLTHALSAPEQRAAATALAVEPPEAASLGQTATPEVRKQIARWIYEDKIEQEQGGSKPASRASSSADVLVKKQSPPFRERLNQPPRAELENDPHYRHIPNWAVSGHKMPDNGTFPAVMIAGQGKCGTN
eukprot:scaffold22708_cov69-Phaeocystis_antarctica.AAC.1